MCGIVSFGNGLLIDGHRRIDDGLQELKQIKDGRFLRGLRAQEIQDGLRIMMDLIRLDTQFYLVRLTRGGETIVYSPYLFVVGQSGPTPGTCGPPRGTRSPARRGRPKRVDPRCPR